MSNLNKAVCSGVGIVFLVCMVFGVDYVPPGSVGIKVSLMGQDKGVQDTTTKTGYIWYNRLSTRIYEYPVFVQRHSFTQDLNEDSPFDESITFNSKEGTVINADIGIHYQVNSLKVSELFVKLRGDNNAVREYMKTRVRKAISDIAKTMDVNMVYGEGNSELINKAQEELNRDELVHVELLGFIGALRLPDNVVTSINRTIEAKQAAIAAQNKVAESKALADQKIEEARGKGESVLLEAQKQAEANEILTKSITPELIHYQTIEKWDGKLPTVTSDTIPLIQIK